MHGKGRLLAVEELSEPTPGGDIIWLDELPERFEALKRPTTECKVLIEP
jgi:hypothetical protein